MFWIMVAIAYMHGSVIVSVVKPDPAGGSMKFATEAACEGAVKTFMGNLPEDPPEGVEAVSAQCVSVSDPRTEQKA